MSDYDITKLVDTPPAGYARVDAFYTAKNDAVYAILPRRPVREVVLDDIDAPSGVRVTLLEGGQQLESTRQGRQLQIRIPDAVSASVTGTPGIRLEARRRQVSACGAGWQPA